MLPCVTKAANGLSNAQCRAKVCYWSNRIGSIAECVVQGNTKAKECREAAAAAAAAAEKEAQLDADAEFLQPLHRRLLSALAA